mgnify:CR=1 FL=1
MDFLLSDKKEHIDRLFTFKIFLFEQDIVKNYKNEKIIQKTSMKALLSKVKKPRKKEICVKQKMFLSPSKIKLLKKKQKRNKKKTISNKKKYLEESLFRRKEKAS